MAELDFLAQMRQDAARSALGTGDRTFGSAEAAPEGALPASSPRKTVEGAGGYRYSYDPRTRDVAIMFDPSGRARPGMVVKKGSNAYGKIMEELVKKGAAELPEATVLGASPGGAFEMEAVEMPEEMKTVRLPPSTIGGEAGDEPGPYAQRRIAEGTAATEGVDEISWESVVSKEGEGEKTVEAKGFFEDTLSGHPLAGYLKSLQEKFDPDFGFARAWASEPKKEEEPAVAEAE